MLLCALLIVPNVKAFGQAREFLTSSFVSDKIYAMGGYNGGSLNTNEALLAQLSYYFVKN